MTPDQIAAILNDLGTRLGPAGQQAFALAVREQYIEGIIGLLLVIPGVICLWACRWTVGWMRRDKGSYSNDREPVAAGAVLLFGGIALGTFGNAVLFAIPQLLNPEWHAITSILSSITGSN